MNPTHPQPVSNGINPAQLLPSNWSLKHDVLLIVGEHAGAIARPFASHGLARVIAMFPDGIPNEPAGPGVTVVTSRQELNDAVMLFGGDDPERWAMIRTPQCSLPTHVTDELQQLLGHAVKLRKANKLTVHDLSHLWAQNGLKNLVRIAENPLVNDVGHALQGIPLIVVGAGPSLAKNIDMLRQAKGKAIILCVNRALRSLQNAGIQPDLAINVEPQDVACQFDGIDTSALQGLILCATSHPPLYELDAPNILSFVGNQDTDGWMLPEPVEAVPAGGSVSCSSVSLGLLWKCDPIIMVGQDLSFPGGAYYHADGADGDTRAVFNSASGLWELEGHSDDLRNTVLGRTGDGIIRLHGTQVPGYFGGMVETSMDFANFRMWFQHTVQDNPSTRFFNCTEGGARIDGMNHQSLESVLSQLPTRDFDLASAFNSETVQAKVHQRSHVMKTLGQRTRKGLHRAIRQAQRCVELIDASATSERALQRLGKAEADLKKTTRKMMVLSLMDQAKIQDVMARAKAATTMAESLAAARELYQFIVDDGRRLIG